MPSQYPRNPITYISLLHRASRKACDAALRPYGLSSGNYYYLLAVGRQPGCTLSELVGQLEVDKAHVTRTVRHLEELGYLRRVVSPSDSRAFQLYLTERGEKTAQALVPIFRDWSRSLSAAFSQEEYETLLTLLERAVLYLDEMPPPAQQKPE